MRRNESDILEDDVIEDEPGSNNNLVEASDINPTLLGYRCAAYILQLFSTTLCFGKNNVRTCPSRVQVFEKSKAYDVH
jgi:hypothetical protein